MGGPEENRSKLGELLIAAGEISPEQLETALEEQRNWGGLLGLTLVRLGFSDEHIVLRTLAEQLHLPVVQLQGKRVNAEVLDLVSVDIAEKYRCLPLLVNGEGGEKALYLGMEDPSDPAILAEISELLGMNIQPVMVAQTELNEAIQRHYHWKDYGSGVLGSKFADTQGSAATDSSAPEGAGDPAAPASEEAGSPPSEPVFADLHRLNPEPGKSRPFHAPSPLAGAKSGGGGPGKNSGASDPMLRALAQLLVEKGLITRDELVDRLRTVLKSEPDS